MNTFWGLVKRNLGFTIRATMTRQPACVFTVKMNSVNTRKVRVRVCCCVKKMQPKEIISN